MYITWQLIFHLLTCDDRAGSSGPSCPRSTSTRHWWHALNYLPIVYIQILRIWIKLFNTTHCTIDASNWAMLARVLSRIESQEEPPEGTIKGEALPFFPRRHSPVGLPSPGRRKGLWWLHRPMGRPGKSDGGGGGGEEKAEGIFRTTRQGKERSILVLCGDLQSYVCLVSQQVRSFGH